MQQYLDVLREVRHFGFDMEGRNGRTRKMFVRTMRFNMSSGKFPAITTKKLAFRSVVNELVWFIQMRNRADNNALVKLGTNIWTANAHSYYWQPRAKFKGDLGRIYGVQWRTWLSPDGNSIDQLGDVIKRIKSNPYDRRLVVTAWNPGEIEDMALPPCHMFFQFNVEGDNLSMCMYQRSCDMFLGVPFNISSYALLLCLVAQVTGLKPYEFIHILGDTHIYHQHFGAVDKQLMRSPLESPSIWINPDIQDIDDFSPEDIKLVDYNHHPHIKAKMIT